MAPIKPTRLQSLYDTMVKYKRTRDEADTLWAQLTCVLPNISHLEIDTFLNRHKPKKVLVKKKTLSEASPKKIPLKAKAAPQKLTKRQIGERISKSRKAVAHGEIPPLKERLRQVLGSKELEVKEVIAALAKKDWLPDSKDPSTYMSFMLSSNPNDFERVSRGTYRVRADPSSMKGQRDALYRWAATQVKMLTPESIQTLKDVIPTHLKEGWVAYLKCNRKIRQRELKAAAAEQPSK